MNLDIHQGNKEDLKAIYQRFVTDFPPEELKSYQHLEQLLEKKQYKLLLAKDRNKNVGYALIYELSQIQAIWLDYIAIDENYRNFGYGTYFLNKLGESSGIFIEVEIPDEGVSRKNQLRRIDFYERLGAKKLHISYQLPTNNGGYPMYLYFRPTTKVRRLTKGEIQEVITEVFESIHSDVKNRDPILTRIWPTIGDEQF